MRHRFKALTLPRLKHVGFSVQRMVSAVEIARFGAILRERPIIAIGLRWLFPNSGVGIRQ